MSNLKSKKSDGGIDVKGGRSGAYSFEDLGELLERIKLSLKDDFLRIDSVKSLNERFLLSVENIEREYECFYRQCRELAILSSEVESESDVTRGEIKNAIEELESLKGEFFALDSTYRQQCEFQENLKCMLGNFKLNYSDLKKECSELVSKLKNLKKSESQVKNEILEKKAAFSLLERSHAQLNSRVASVERDTKALESEVVEVVEELECMREDNERMLLVYEDMKCEYEKNVKNKNVIMEEIDSRSRTISELQKTLLAQDKLSIFLVSEVGELNEMKKILELSIKHVEEECSAVACRNDKIKDSFSGLRDEVELLTLELDSQNTYLNKLRDCEGLNSLMYEAGQKLQELTQKQLSQNREFLEVPSVLRLGQENSDRRIK